MGKRLSHNKAVRVRSSWTSRLMGVILLVVVGLLSFGFLCCYEIFIMKLEQTNLKATTLVFEQTQRNISRKLQTAAEDASRLLLHEAVDDYLGGTYKSLPEETLVIRKTADELADALSLNKDLAALALIDSRGRSIAATSWGMTAAAFIDKESPACQYLYESEYAYPFYIWSGAEEARQWFAQIPRFQNYFEGRKGIPARMLTGVRTISYETSNARSAYLMVSVSDTAIQECYSQVLYNQNTVLLLDRSEAILSATDGRPLNEKPPYAPQLPDKEKAGSFSFRQDAGEEYQIIYYTMPQYGWTLVNEIPKRAYRQQADELKVLLLIVWFMTLSLMLLFFVIWIGRYTRPVERIIYSMKKVQDGDLSPVSFPPSGIQEMDELGEQFAITVSTIGTLIHRVRNMDKEKAREELKTLQYQINPHFLYNSLSSIRFMALMNNNPKIADSLLLLARIIEPILRAPSSYWSVEEELAFVDSYVKMLTLRFGGALAYEADCDTQFYDRQFPRFTLQPILENCFTHGMIPGDTLRIRVSLTGSDGKLQITVINTGSHIEPDKRERLNDMLSRHMEPDGAAGSIGLLNVNKRLFLLYGMSARMHIHSDETSDTAVIIEIPDQIMDQS